MYPTKHHLIDELRSLTSALGEQGGLVSPSVYDTAQILRLYPPTEGIDRALVWLLDQQHPDGGWGQPTVPAERTVPTLAALLTLKTYQSTEAASNIAAGLAFLESQQGLWRDIHIDLVPIAAEMIVPALLDEAEHLGLVIDRKPYALLFEMRRRKLERLAEVPIRANTAPAYSWEALGLPFSVDVLDPHAGVGHSPAATAAWLKQAREYQVDPALRAKAEAYLARAHAATQSDIPGLYPVVYPIRGFELTYGLYALLLNNLLDHPDLQPTVTAKLQELADIMAKENGISFGDGFVPDVDDTAVAVAVLRACGRDADPQWVKHFWYEDHFYTYVHELNPSVFSNAHALHALSWCDIRCERTEKYLLDRQTMAGYWTPDKWHTSWRSTTMEAVASLCHLDDRTALRRAAEAFRCTQLDDGGWGNTDDACPLETAYAIIALKLIRQCGCTPQGLEDTLARAEAWYVNNWDAAESDEREMLWLGKVVYTPERVDRLYRYSVRLRIEMDWDDTQTVRLDEFVGASHRLARGVAGAVGGRITLGASRAHRKHQAVRSVNATYGEPVSPSS